MEERKEDRRESFKRETVYRNCVKKGVWDHKWVWHPQILACHSLSPLTYKKLSTPLVCVAMGATNEVIHLVYTAYSRVGSY